MKMTLQFFLQKTALASFFLIGACFTTNAQAENSPSKPVTSDMPSVEILQQMEVGAKGYATACVSCHQPNGEGIPNVYPPLVGSEWVKGSEERVIAIVLYGLTGPITVNSITYPGIPMPAFTQGSTFNWSDEQIAATLTYVRHAWGNKAPPVAAKKVAEVRTKMGTRTEMTEEELKKVP